MRRSTDTLARQWDILAMIPKEPRSITAAQLQRRLAGTGHEASVRTIQRDLTVLETQFMLKCSTEGRVNHWYWQATQPPLQIPRLSSVTAITLLLVRDYLTPLLPRTVSEELSPHFSTASGVLMGTKLERWRERVRMVERGPLLRVPEIEPGVRDAVYEALLEGRQLEAEYRSREAEAARMFTINPLGLVFKNEILYLVATLWDYADPHHLALHRMSRAECLDRPAAIPESFDLESYVNKAAFGYPVSGDTIKLVAKMNEGVAAHLYERQLAPDQRLEPLDDGCVVLRATVPDTQELRWWLLGFGDQVEVLGPAPLRADIGDAAVAMVEKYAESEGVAS